MNVVWRGKDKDLSDVNMCFASGIRILLMTVLIGCSQGKPDITILNDLNRIACGSSTKIKCNITANVFVSMYWYVNGVSIRECDETTCYTTGVSLPDNYILSNTGKIFYLEINPVTFNDNSNVACTDGQMSETVTISPKTEITNVTLTRNESIDGNKVTITVLSNCVEMASGATFELSKQKSSEQQFVQVPELMPIKTTIPCTNDENPDCGGNQTSRVNIVTNIQNDSTGDVYTFRLKVTYDGSDSWITLGTYTIATEDLDSSEDSSSWCKNNLNECVSMSVVVSGVALSIIIAIIVAVAKGQTNQARARQPEVVSGADKDSKVDKHNDPIQYAEMVVKNVPISVTNETIKTAFEAIGVKLTNIRNDQNTLGLDKILNCTTVDRIVTVTVKSLNEHQSEFVDIGQFKLKKENEPGNIRFEYSCVIKEITVIVKDVPTSVTNATIESAFKKMKQQGIDVLHATNTASYNRKSRSETIDRTVTIKEPGESLPVVMPIDRFKFILHCVPSNKHFKFIYSLTEMTLLFKGVPADTFSIETMLTMLKQICLQVVYISIDMNGKRHDNGLKCLTYDLDVTVSEKDKGSSVCLVDHLPSNVTFSSYDFQQKQEHTVYLNSESDRFKKAGHSMSTDNTKTSRTYKEMDTLTFTGVPLSLNIYIFASKIEAEIDKENKQRVLKVTIDYVKHDYEAVDLKAIVSDKCYEPTLKSEIEVDGLIFRKSTIKHTTYKFVKSANKNRQTTPHNHHMFNMQGYTP